jgi:hypothetical protein
MTARQTASGSLSRAPWRRDPLLRQRIGADLDVHRAGF